MAFVLHCVGGYSGFGSGFHFGIPLKMCIVFIQKRIVLGFKDNDGTVIYMQYFSFIRLYVCI